MSVHIYLRLRAFFLNCVKYVTTCSISFIAPAVWNSLLATLRNLPNLPEFKTQLKTFLFKQT